MGQLNETSNDPDVLKESDMDIELVMGLLPLQEVLLYPSCPRAPPRARREGVYCARPRDRDDLVRFRGRVLERLRAPQVANYLSNDPGYPSLPTTVFQRAGRAYPDVAANPGELILFFVFVSSWRQAPDGDPRRRATHAGGPNDARIVRGKEAVGWINPACISLGPGSLPPGRIPCASSASLAAQRLRLALRPCRTEWWSTPWHALSSRAFELRHPPIWSYMCADILIWAPPELYSNQFKSVFNDVTNGSNPGGGTPGF
ncbi:hypothetical protein GSI_02260 [Ganoderma sinense ZZ0214-1]|uniref:Uncharacterized protein n=1 Tax=Ganoderma sinense ZZ0214-1 TaxID=1077348 RepID=A0A2G8SP58_9APHY|nr:hypothetical protein GSI_02260 [Ganoderma sinense ZZ0214-1]